MNYYNEETGKVIPVIDSINDVVNYYHLGLKEGDSLSAGYEYIGRKNFNPVLKELPESIFHNPFPVRKTNDKKERIKARIESVNNFKKYFWKKLLSNEITKEQLLSLDKKKLICFCGDNLCHGHVIKLFIHYVKTHELEFEQKKREYQERLNNKKILPENKNSPTKFKI